MEHSFDIEDALKLGLNEAIILKNLKFWIAKNKANKKHFYEGRHWTYNSNKAFLELFPYFSEGIIKRTLQNLKEQKIILFGSWSQDPFDKTNWYALVEENSLQNEPIDKLNLANDNDEPKLANRQANSSLSFIGTDNKHTDINTDSKLHERNFKFYLDRKPNAEDRTCFNSVLEFLDLHFDISTEVLKKNYGKNLELVVADFEKRNFKKSWKDAEDLRNHFSNFAAKWQPTEIKNTTEVVKHIRVVKPENKVIR